MVSLLSGLCFIACTPTTEAPPDPPKTVGEAPTEVPARQSDDVEHEASGFHTEVLSETERDAIVSRMQGEWIIHQLLENDSNGEFEVALRDEYWDETRETWRFRSDGTFHHLFNATLTFSGTWVVKDQLAGHEGLPKDCCFVLETTNVRASIPGDFRPIEYWLGRVRPETDLLAFHFVGSELNKIKTLKNGRGFRRKVPR